MQAINESFVCKVKELIFSNGVDHRRPDIRMAEHFLDRAYIVVRLQEMRGKGMTEGRYVKFFLKLIDPQSRSMLLYPEELITCWSS